MKEAKEGILNGIHTTADIVASTMGPHGRKVGLVDAGGDGYVSQDGVNVCEFVAGSFTDRFESFGAKLLTDAANKTVETAGDGTTTTCIIASALIKAFDNKPIDDASVKSTAQLIVDEIKKRSKKPTKAQLVKMTKVVARNNPKEGQMIAELIWKLGEEAHIQSFPGPETKTEIKKGYSVDTGFSVPFFWGAKPAHSVQVGRGVIQLVDPLILLAEEQISSIEVLRKVIESYSLQSDNWVRPLVIVVSEMKAAALEFILQNFRNEKRPMPVFLIQAPHSGIKRTEILDDLKAGLGGSVYAAYTGKKVKNFDGKFGEAETVTITKEDVHFLFKSEHDLAVTNRAASIEDEERISKLTDGVGIIHIGGRTEVEYKELAEVIEDCVLSAQSAMKNGVVPGANYTLMTVIDTLIGKEDPTGITDLFYSAAVAISEQLGVPLSATEYRVYNLLTGKYEDHQKTNILDSTAALTESILNATSLACEVKNIDYAVVSLRR